jgi:hypothetical protein
LVKDPAAFLRWFSWRYGELSILCVCVANLALTMWNLGRWTEAEKMFVQVMEMRKRVLAEEHPDTLASMKILAFKMIRQ